MKFLYDFFPILLFFITYKLQGIYAAVVVTIIASVAQVGYSWLRHHRVEKMHVISAGLVVVMGGLTIILHDKEFFMWKPTLINWLFAAVFLGSQFIGQKPLIQRMLSSQLDLPSPIWRRLNTTWIVFFLLSGIANLYFVQDYAKAEEALRVAVPSIQQEQIDTLACETDFEPETRNLCEVARDKEEIWVNFKLFGLLGLTFVFIIGQAAYLTRYIQEEPETAPKKETP